MTSSRFLPLIPISIVLAGCGARTITPSATPQSSAQGVSKSAQNARVSTPPRVTTTAPTPKPAAILPGPATPTPQTASSNAMLVVEQPASNGMYSVSLVNAAGHSLATTRVSSRDEWTVVAGHGGAYWMDGGRVKLLTQSGTVRDIGGVPAGAGELLVSPDGSAYAYDTNTVVRSSSAATENRIIVQVVGGPARIIADRISDPSHPTADAPPQWMYGLMSWTKQGILFRREVTGTCGCQAFDMQTLAGYTGIIDPGSDNLTDLTSNTSCPLTALGAGMATGCFHGISSGAADMLRIVTAGRMTSQLALSGKNVGGDGVFSADGTTLAYETVPTADAGCGSSAFPTTLHLLDISSGSVRATQITGLHAKLWPGGGPIYGDVDSASGSAVVTVDPATMAVHRVLTGPAGTRFVGVV